MIGISLDDADTHKRVEHFLEEHGIRYPVYLAGPEGLDQIYATGDVFIPLSFLVDDKGNVQDRFAGWSPTARRRLLDLIQ